MLPGLLASTGLRQGASSLAAAAAAGGGWGQQAAFGAGLAGARLLAACQPHQPQSGADLLQLQQQQQPQQQRQHQQGRGFAAKAGGKAATPQSAASSLELDLAAAGLGEGQALHDQLMQVLLHPLPRNATWNAQLSPHLVQLNEQLLVQPASVLTSLLRALHVIRGVLAEDGHVYVVENNRLLRPLLKAASHACLNPNVWFLGTTWSPGMLTNYGAHRRLFKESHQPNRRLFAAKGYRMVNPLCPEPPPASGRLPRLSWDDKWLLFRHTRRPGYRALLQELLGREAEMHRLKPSGSLRGVPANLRLMVFLDSTKNAVAIREAYHRNIPVVAITNTVKDMAQVTYPVIARDFSPAFVHFFLDWIVKVANARPNAAPEARQALVGSGSKDTAS